jgi:hypothetical protein
VVKDSSRFPQRDIRPRIVSVYAVIHFLTATFGHADIQMTRSIRKKTLSYRILSRSRKYVLTRRIKYQ